MTAPLLTLRGVDYAYPGGVMALRQLDLTIAAGRKLAILGANGSGKTTLLLHLNGTLQPAGGEILLHGQPARYDRQSLTDWRRRVGLVLQEPDDQLFAATVKQDVSFGPLNLGWSTAEVRARVTEALRALQIADLADRATHTLSFGQKKRVAIAGILVMRPALLALDEPTAGLDAQGVIDLLSALQHLHQAGATLVFATHDVELAYAWADCVAIFHQGTVLRQGETTSILTDRELLRLARLQPPLLMELAELLPAPLLRSREAVLTHLKWRLHQGTV